MEFSDIALAKLLQTAPELGPLILTFQDVSEELDESSGNKVGVFVLRSGSDLFFVPVVAKNENIYPIDSVFFDSKKKFFPLTKKTLASIQSANQLTQGKATTIPPTVTINPSVYGIVTPPRTGKYAYASASRLADFLSSMPDYLKSRVFEKIAAEKSVYDDLDKMYSLKAIIDALTPARMSSAAVTNVEPVSIITSGRNLNSEVVNAILKDGYYVQGRPETTRVALSVEDFNKVGTTREVSAADEGSDFELAFANEPSREALIIKRHAVCGNHRFICAIFGNGDYAIRDSFIVVGEPLERKKVLDRVLYNNPPVLLKDTFQGDRVVIMTPRGEFIGPLEINQIALSNLGVKAKVSQLSHGYSIQSINAFSTFTGPIENIDGTLYIPHNSVVIKLKKDVTTLLDRSLNSAARRKQIELMQYLGAEMRLGYDGIDFSINGAHIGGAPKVMEILVVKEGISPEKASEFVKQAKESKYTKIYLTKQAFSSDYAPASIPQHGLPVSDNMIVTKGGGVINGTQGDASDQQGLIPAIQDSLKLQDGQVTESVIISELLQVPDMFEKIDEYMPDLEEAIDKLGRILFMSRVHLDKLSVSSDAESVFAFLAQLKAVYRLLGDNFLKLQELVAVNNRIDQEQMH